MIKTLFKHLIIEYAIDYAFEQAIVNLKYPERKNNITLKPGEYIYFIDVSWTKYPLTKTIKASIIQDFWLQSKNPTSTK